jgi:hypothetical protein
VHKPLTHFSGNGRRSEVWRLLTRGPVELHFIGASVTVQRDSWADRLADLVSERTGHRHVVTKNAMGGVGLLFGVANYAQPAAGLARIVFIEFSTGDLNLGLTPLEHLQMLLEHLILRSRADGAEIVIVHNWRADFDVADRAGIRARYDEVARARGIPVIANHAFAHSCLEADPSLRGTGSAMSATPCRKVPPDTPSTSWPALSRWRIPSMEHSL